ncbi:Uncharacterized protein OBRU01_25383, partial [Operophtera brumata]
GYECDVILDDGVRRYLRPVEPAQLHSTHLDENPFLQWEAPGIGRYLFMTVTDSDVSSERARVCGMSRPELARSSLVCRDLCKFYGSLLAVNRLSFGECFGLLGINGAGKTSAFRMLTGDSHIGSGDAFVHGLSLKTQVQEVHKHIVKTSAFRMLTGDSHIVSGDAFVHGLSLKTQVQEVHKHIVKTSAFRMLTGDSHIGSGDAFVHGPSLKTQVQEVHKHIVKTSAFRMLTCDSHIGSGDAFVHGLSLKTQVQEVHKHIVKTSAFRMLTGDLHIGSGDAFVRGLLLKTQVPEVHKHIDEHVPHADGRLAHRQRRRLRARTLALDAGPRGYCPQFDALFDTLTARETLHIFSLLRGIPARRKISTAVALLGDSSLLYLDEPTTGMDPASKRLVWSSISAAARSGRSVVLTSHSMEECEALCSRLTVMVSGRLHCLGPLQHLKTKFSQGFTLIVKCEFGPDREADLAKIDKYIQDNIIEAKLIESYLGISTYYLNDAELPWWRVFHVMEAARDLFPIEDYAVSQTTLEQVFLRFTRIHAHQD